MDKKTLLRLDYRCKIPYNSAKSLLYLPEIWHPGAPPLRLAFEQLIMIGEGIRRRSVGSSSS
jgi:hypothetical protein